MTHKILIADDEPNIVISLEYLLQREGYAVLVARDGQEALEALERRSVPGWLELEKEAFTGVMKATPTREDITMPVQEQLIVELYSR